MTDPVQRTLFLRPDSLPDKRPRPSGTAPASPSPSQGLPDFPPDIVVVEEMAHLPADVWTRLDGTGLSVLAAPGVDCAFLLLKHFPAARIVCIPTRPGDEPQAWDLASYVRFKAPHIGIVLLGDGVLAPDL
ncbi:hypothetical protein [Falsirhodobacter sp. 1013]|uniref:hypothetical protein n=1 Tax=Falsirhodobacter sp. 1013 TaxID=3417566 RepID=UPI003EBB7337